MSTIIVNATSTYPKTSHIIELGITEAVHFILLWTKSGRHAHRLKEEYVLG